MELNLTPLNLPSDQERAFIIAGPCSAETEEQVMTTAKQLAGKGCHIFRAGVWKPRTKPECSSRQASSSAPTAAATSASASAPKRTK